MSLEVGAMAGGELAASAGATGLGTAMTGDTHGLQDQLAAGTKLADTAAAQDKRSKKQQGKKRGRNAGATEQIALTAAQSDHLRIVRVEGRKDPAWDDKSSPVVLLSKAGKAPQLTLSDDRLSVSGTKGFRTARTTHGVHEGTWYCEVHVTHLGPSGHVRLGWGTRRAELQAPVGFDKHGMCYRDVEGSKVHQGLREAYGEAYVEGDTIGLLIHLPPGGHTCEITDRPVVRYKGGLYFVDEPLPTPQPLQGSQVVFTRNGVPQGVAYSDILEGTYYPAASLYTLPSQTTPAQVTFNFGPDFKYPPPQLDGVPPAQPMCAVPAWLAERAAAAELERAAADAAAIAAAADTAGVAAGLGAMAGAESLTAGEALVGGQPVVADVHGHDAAVGAVPAEQAGAPVPMATD